jgi:hypothetical protein
MAEIDPVLSEEFASLGGSGMAGLGGRLTTERFDF